MLKKALTNAFTFICGEGKFKFPLRSFPYRQHNDYWFFE